MYSCAYWGTKGFLTTCPITSSNNIASVIGDAISSSYFTVTFAAPMTDANYVVLYSTDTYTGVVTTVQGGQSTTRFSFQATQFDGNQMLPQNINFTVVGN